MKRIFFIFIMLCNNYLIANMNPFVGFEMFKNYYFVETGTYQGQGIQLALRAQFPVIYSIEINSEFVKNAQNVFKDKQNVHIHLGDSGKELYNIISKIDKPITFWLDGHHGTPSANGEKNTPLLEELEQIKKHYIKSHTIIIDDMHCCGTILFDYITKEDIIKKLKEINPLYTITYINGGDQAEYVNNIMIARLEEDYTKK